MPELRKDPVLGRWVIIATERGRRPSDFEARQRESRGQSCPFCEGRERETPPEVYAVREEGSAPNSPGWHVRVIANKYPALNEEGRLNRQGVGMCDMANGIGVHEVIVETPHHDRDTADLSAEQISVVLGAYRQRIVALREDKRLKYVLIFKNQGRSAGASLQHAHSQLIATPITPKRVKEKLDGAKRYFDYKHRCVFCDYIKQETELFGHRLVEDTDHFVALSPFAARFPFETWILPKRHMLDFSLVERHEMDNLGHLLKLILMKLRRALSDPPFNYVLHQAPYRRPRGGYWTTIEEDYHWHIELIPRLTRMAGFEWGSGFYINPTAPEAAARVLRDTEV